LKFISACLAISGTLVAACGGAPDVPSVGASATLTASSRSSHTSEDEAEDAGPGRCPKAVDFDGVSEHVERQLNIARHAVCKYRRIEAALAAGYANSGLPCVPGQGYHYIKSSLVGTTDIREPSVLMYTADGDLNSPEWIAPQSDFPTPPSIFGQSLHSEDELGLWILHVWVWKLNPNGVFDDVNPQVTCP
jgi:hypothetical protein